MRLKLFRAPGTREAMARIRSELGPDALILATRRVAGGVEVTAALEAEDAPPLPCPPTEPEPETSRFLAWHGMPPALTALLGQEALEHALARHLPFALLPLAPNHRPLLLVGPPGAGKTLTTARLATQLVLEGTTPLVITADSRRAGGAEQLAAFTRLLRLDLLVAGDPVVLGRALARRDAGAPVLIDAPGLDPFDSAQREELSALAAVANAETALVLPAGTDAAEAADLAEAHAAIGATMLIATRLDSARRVGAIPAAAHAARLALAAASASPGAADPLVPLTPAFLAARLRRVPEAHP